LKEKDPSIDPNILNLPPIRLEILFDNYYQGGYLDLYLPFISEILY
jgi:hypothetical protein